VRSRPLGTPLTDAELTRLGDMEARPEADEALTERLARAMCAADFDYFGNVDWGGSSNSVRNDYRRMARVALEILRTPVEES
jgi:hypothetical protein